MHKLSAPSFSCLNFFSFIERGCSFVRSMRVMGKPPLPVHLHKGTYARLISYHPNPAPAILPSLPSPRWTFIGLILQIFGFVNLFGNFFPPAIAVMQHTPVLKDILRLPGIRYVISRLGTRSRAPV